MSAQDDLPRADVDRERRLGYVIGPIALAALTLLMVSIPVGARGLPDRGDGNEDRNLLLDVKAAEDDQVLALILRSSGLLLLVPVAFFLWKLTRDRNPGHWRWVPFFGTFAFALVATMGWLDFRGTLDVADEFLGSGARTNARAEDLLDEARSDGPLQGIALGTALGALFFGIWVSIASLEGARVGLLTRFLGVFGIGAGLATALVASAGFVLFIGWLGSLGCLMLGAWPGGRPPAWDEGRAVSQDEMNRRDAMRRRALG